MATMKKCFNDVHLRKLLVCAIFITLKSCCCTNISRNAITLIDSFSPMFHGMRIEDDCRRSNAYHTCGCRCFCSYSNSTFDESSQKCVNNAELRRREGKYVVPRFELISACVDDWLRDKKVRSIRNNLRNLLLFYLYFKFEADLLMETYTNHKFCTCFVVYRILLKRSKMALKYNPFSACLCL